MERYIGLDAHTSSCTVAVIGQSGKRLRWRRLVDKGTAVVVVEATAVGPVVGGAALFGVRRPGGITSESRAGAHQHRRRRHVHG